jgi:hypothetical protein
MSKNKSAFPIDTISAGVFIIILAGTYVLYSPYIDVNEVITYFRNIPIHLGETRPPQAIMDAAVFFFNSIGVWTLVVAGLRIVFQRSVPKALGDVTGAFFSFFTSYLITNYAFRVFTWQTAVAYFIIGIGTLIIVNALTYFVFSEKQSY